MRSISMSEKDLTINSDRLHENRLAYNNGLHKKDKAKHASPAAFVAFNFNGSGHVSPPALNQGGSVFNSENA